ncbi:FABP family protein [Cryobacterium sp. PH29-G1]|uniref:FABP family protein n=1 Tax=Cryobacterium sp. PH29-G1 TaxID=3046211 RepID=UPI0024BB610B|nr:FABP family protein [Cryobacterium sp. PH29-G1]MDJ0350655.1 FABP family protein [Cryobacterium sp. PH29-G1]
MFDLPVGLPSELVPLSWLIGVWEGSGVLEYKIGEESVSRTFGHRISFSHDGLPHLNYSSYTWLEPETPATTDTAGLASEADAAALAASSAVTSPDATADAAALAASSAETPAAAPPARSASILPPELLSDERTPLVTETGYWRLSRHQGDGDPGPGMLPGTGERPFTSAAAVETLRNRDGGFDIEATLVHPGGVAELYLGQVKGPRIDLATDAVLRTAGAKPYAAATRMYGLVDNHLLWAWDIAALGQDLRTHASGRLARVE